MTRGNGVTDPANPAHEGINSYGAAYFLSRTQAIDCKELRRFAEELMRVISETSIQQGAKDIGHIKAYIEHAGGFLHASTVGDPADVTVAGSDGPPVNAVQLTLNTVVYGIDAPTVRAATEESLSKVLGKFRLQRAHDKTEQTRNPGGETP